MRLVPDYTNFRNSTFSDTSDLLSERRQVLATRIAVSGQFATRAVVRRVARILGDSPEKVEQDFAGQIDDLVELLDPIPTLA